MVMNGRMGRMGTMGVAGVTVVGHLLGQRRQGTEMDLKGAGVAV